MTLKYTVDTPVYISPEIRVTHPHSPLAGRTGIVVHRELSPLAALEHTEHFLPIESEGIAKVYFVEPEYVFSLAALEQEEEMRVTVMYRSNCGDDGRTCSPMRLFIATHCVVCGARRGRPQPHAIFIDGDWVEVDTWENPCGHLDGYHACSIEAATRSAYRMHTEHEHKRRENKHSC